MKMLLHNKRFRKNLKRWLFAYIFVMLSFSLVITYSKYITSMSVDEAARPAKFNVEIKYDESLASNCETDDITGAATCSTGSYRPTSEIPYQFSVDTRGLEVATTFLLDIKVDDDFEIIKLEEVISETVLVNKADNSEDNAETSESSPVFESRITYLEVTEDESEDPQIVRLIKEVEAGKGESTTYRITVKYKGNTDRFTNVNPYEIIKIDYLATQKTK